MKFGVLWQLIGIIKMQLHDSSELLFLFGKSEELDCGCLKKWKVWLVVWTSEEFDLSVVVQRSEEFDWLFEEFDWRRVWLWLWKMEESTQQEQPGSSQQTQEVSLHLRLGYIKTSLWSRAIHCCSVQCNRAIALLFPWCYNNLLLVNSHPKIFI